MFLMQMTQQEQRVTGITFLQVPLHTESSWTCCPDINSRLPSEHRIILKSLCILLKLRPRLLSITIQTGVMKFLHSVNQTLRRIPPCLIHIFLREPPAQIVPDLPIIMESLKRMMALQVEQTLSMQTVSFRIMIPQQEFL